MRKEKISPKTIEEYLGYFMDSFILNEASRYDLKGRRKIGALKKYYFSDLGLRNARVNFAYGDRGHLLENLVYNELILNGYTVNIGVFDRIEKDRDGKSARKSYEIDFYARKNDRRYYIQVSENISGSDTKAREIKPFLLLNDTVTKILVIDRPVAECIDKNGFTVIGITEFLLKFII